MEHEGNMIVSSALITIGITPIVISALETIHKGLIKRLEDLEIRGQVEIIQTTALLR